MHRCDCEANRYSEGFKDNCFRIYFIRGVFCLLIMIFMLMFGQMKIVEMNENVNAFLVENYWLAFIGVTFFLCLCLVLSCSNLARSCFPWNFILLLALVENLTLILAVVGALYGTLIIFLCLAILSVLLFFLLVSTLMGPVDFTNWTSLLLVIFFISFIYSVGTIISIFTVELPLMDIIYSMIIVTVLAVVMMLNIQVLFNGTIYELCPDDFILGAILIFSHIIIFFMCCLQIVGFDPDGC
ncbi:CLUMA_CG016165, isoform A [Clunio marinus]|uniref:CLUMA_CG016165, isoform A n=1 Tax=Clunio marinus TaxID=568069 RepID=A0A1J1IUF1_9DIPT|nr:CLUMA_CG016165, isoform A [Clunio marinus]